MKTTPHVLDRMVAYAMQKKPRPHITRQHGQWVALTMGLWQTQRSNCHLAAGYVKQRNRREGNKAL